MRLGGNIPPPLGIQTLGDMLGKQISVMFQSCYKEIIQGVPGGMCQTSGECSLG